MKTKYILTLLFLLAGHLYSTASQTRKVLIIGIDGCRSDALQQANTPNMDGLLANSLYTYDAWHVGITWSGPSWSTILTGVHWNKHGVTGNTFSGSNFNQYPAFPKRAKEIKPNLKCVEVVEWDPLADDFYNDGWDKKVKVADGSTSPTADSAIIQLQDPDIDALFVYFDKVDLTGHSTTFSPSNPSYITAIQTVDQAIGRVLTALYARPDYANEDWLILFITDHGGASFFHGGNSNAERHIWWIATGNVVQHQQINEADPGTYNCHLNNSFDSTCVDRNLLRMSPTQPDIAVTALHHLIFDSGINPETRQDWNLDGKSWLTIPTAVAENSQNNILVYPNPTNGAITILYNNTNGKTHATLFDILGKQIAMNESFMHDRMVLDISSQPSGNYLLHIKTDDQVVVKKISRMD